MNHIEMTAAEEWAFNLDNGKLAEKLNKLSKNVSCLDPDRRAAVLREAALRIYKQDVTPRLRPVS